MTSFLTFTVTAVRISGDIPTQSEYLPLVTLYIVLSMIFTLIGMICFILFESFSKNKKIPGFFMVILFYVKKLINKNKVNTNEKESIQKHSDLSMNIEVAVMSSQLKLEELNDLDKLKSEDKHNKMNDSNKIAKTEQYSPTDYQLEIMITLFKTFISSIQEDKLKRLEIEKNKEEMEKQKAVEEKEKSKSFEENILILNIFFFTLFILLVLIGNLAIWTKISN